jgi:cytochrome-b5 reductase
MTEKDILLREELDALKKAHPKNLDIVYLLDKPDSNWMGGCPKGLAHFKLLQLFD